MGRNVEIKARMTDSARVYERAGAIADGPPEIILQEDTFFTCPLGRLKLRRFSDRRGELIFYRRDDAAGPRESVFSKAPTSDPDRLLEVMTAAFGVLGVVRKRRTLFLADQTRIHLDEVEGLGSFLELEVVLSEHQSVSDGERIAHSMMTELGVAESDLVPVAYIDLLRPIDAADQHDFTELKR
jgi:predicted adenylyl cyclase CyaB